MIKEVIDSISKAEMEAESITHQAESMARTVVADAEKSVKEKKSQAVLETQEMRKKTFSSAKHSGENVYNTSLLEAEEEAKELLTYADAKMSEGVKFVVGRIIS